MARFWSKVAVTPDERECWQWLAGFTGEGYGVFKVEAGIKKAGAHRVAYAIFSGVELAELSGLVVRHSCDNPACCNPFHLSTGTHRDNVKDRMSRGRSAIGEGNGNHKLTEDEVRAIRKDGRTSTVLAEIYGVSKWTIQAVKQRISWKHVE